MGDECRRTQRGNNNAYCQDNQISWFNWKLLEKNEDLVRFVQALIAFRKMNPTVRRTDFLKGTPNRQGELPDVSWFDAAGKDVNWYDGADASLTCIFGAPDVDEDPDRHGRHVMLFVHAGSSPRRSRCPSWPSRSSGGSLSTPAPLRPEDIYDDHKGPPLPTDGKILLQERELRLLRLHPQPLGGAVFCVRVMQELP